MTAPDFTLPDQEEKSHTLSAYIGTYVVLYFYPKDDTPGCTTEACNFQENLERLTSMGVVVLGVSKDSVKSHKKFAEKYHLNFPLLSDEGKKVIDAYHAWGKKKFMGREFEGILRTTYLIGPDQEIKKVYENVNPAKHISEILADIEALKIQR